MGRTLKLGSIAGIRLQIHWTFSLIIVWVLATSLLAGKDWLAAIASVAFVLILFGCVILHELGHALAARWYGIPTRDITLLPIGGVARLERMPRKPSQELVVALAGPAVNVVIAAALFATLAPVGAWGLALPGGSGTFLQQLMFVNVALVVFNLLPAFPLDGGRVLRALLAMFLNYSRATRVAATVGQVCAVGLGFLGLFNPMLLFIGLFIFFGAAAEAQQVGMQQRLDGFRVRDGMLRQFRVVPVNAAVSDCALDMLESRQQDFPVTQDGNFVGMVQMDAVLSVLQDGTATTIGEIMQSDVRPIAEDGPFGKSVRQA
jgi:Zn-dependent protease